MSNKAYVLKTLMDHKMKAINTPLGNEFIIDNEWLLEMDCDGAFAATISHISNNMNKLVFFSMNEKSDTVILLDAKGKIINAIKELQVAQFGIYSIEIN